MQNESAIQEIADRELLQRYAEQASAPAFAELVRRHLNHVFSAALRRVNGEHALAQDVTQMVFADFARKATHISPEMPVGGWLHRHTGFVASKLVHAERRRRDREHSVAKMNEMHANTTPDADDVQWSATAPLLDAAMDTLPTADRDALVLRFFEQKDFRSIGLALGLTDDSAQKRVSRALEKLRQALTRRGVATSGGALASMMALHTLGSAPVVMAGEISTHALATAAAAGGRTLGAALGGLSLPARLQAGALGLSAVVVAALAGHTLLKPTPSAPAASGYAVATTNPSGLTVQSDAAPQKPSTPAPAVDAASLVDAAAAAWASSQGVTATSKALGFLSQISATDIPNALAKVASISQTEVRALLTTNLLNLWAETDPNAALAWTSAHPEANRFDVRQGMLNVIAAKDPNAVMQMASKTRSAQFQPISERVTATLFRTLARNDLANAFAKLNEISSPNDRGQALRGILEIVQTDTERQRVFSLVSAIKDDEIRIQARRAAVEQWAGQNPEDAAAYVAKAEPAWERTRLMDSLGLTWLQSNPAQAAGWWLAQAPGPDTLVKVINVWAQQDANAAGTWLKQHPPGPTSDTARMTFARQVADLDPESALRWAETVSESSLRETTIDHVYTNWNTRDAVAASVFLGKSGWPAERIARFQKITTNQTITP